MGNGLATMAAWALVAGAIILLGALGGEMGARESAAGSPPLVASAPEAGVIAIAGPVPGRIRVLYARNGAMVLLREISVPETAQIRELSLSADGRDLFVATDVAAYALSTRTGRIEAQALATSEGRDVSRTGPRCG